MIGWGNMFEKITRRSFLKLSAGGLLAAAATSAGGLFYSGQVETQLLEINNYKLEREGIPRSFHNKKIVQFSDIHVGFHYNLKQLESLTIEINKIQPDILFFTGDLFDDPNTYENHESVIPLLKNLEAPLGKFAVFGNHDHGGYGTDIYRKIMEKSGFTLLVNEAKEVSAGNSGSIFVIGIDDAMLGKPDLKLATQNVPDQGFNILLSHAPDLADEASRFNIHLQLSGHSHGGQIQIPLMGALVKPPFAEKYVEGFYHAGINNDMLLYVNRGIGTTRLPFRFLSKPELAVFTLHSREG